MHVQGLVWTYQTTTTAVEVDEQIDRLRATSNDNLALSFPKTQAWMLMRSRMQPTLYYPEYICSHHLQRHQFTHRQQELGQRDATTSWCAISCQQNVINQWWSVDGVSWNHEQPWAQEDIPKSSKMKLSCKYQWGSFFDHQDDRRIVNKQRTTFCHAVRQSSRNLSCISNGPQFVNQESTKIKKGWWKKSMQLSGWCKDRA